MAQIPLLLPDPRRTAESACRFLSEALISSGLDGFVVGLSGGVDSALSATLAARAIGPQNVFCVKMPYRTSSPASESHANLLLAQEGMPSARVDISPVVDAYFQAAPDASALRRGNFMARVRMATLFDLSASRSAMVLGTSNKTETLLGYGTWYGDTACSLNPLGELYKTQVWQLSEHLGIPDAIRLKAPTADLWPGQTDEGELGLSYGEVDEILYRLVDLQMAPEAIEAEGYSRKKIAEIARRVAKFAFKRQMPAIAKLF